VKPAPGLPWRAAALLKPGYRCNNRCRFCHARDNDVLPDLGSEAVIARMELALERGCDGLVFSGGEPTLRRDLPGLFRAALDRGLVPGLVTNARRLAYADFAERLLGLGLRYALVSLHAARADVHDDLVRVSGAHDQTVAGLRNLAGRLDLLVVNCVVVRDNLDELEPLVDLVAGIEGARLKLSLVEPKGEARHGFDELVPDLGAAGAAVLAAVARAEECGVGIGYDGFPACAPGAFARYDEHLETHGIRWMNEVDEEELFPADRGERSHPSDPCDRCLWRTDCPGPYAAWAAARGGRELRPFSGPQPNSILLRSRKAGRGERAGERLEVRNGRERLLAELRSQDFSAVELDEAVRLRRQVYLDPGRTGSRPGPGLGLVPLRRESSRGGGRFVRSRRDPFRAEAGRLKRFVSGLEGRVLDIGCGDPVYRDALFARIRRGAITEYVGVDPGPAARRALRGSPDGVRLEAVAVEGFEAPVASFDGALALRCYNHLADPVVALLLLARVLNDRALLWLSDDQPFAVVRSGRPRRGGRFEHYRNAGPDEVLAALAPLPFELLDRRDSGPGTTPSWSLLLRRNPRA